MPWAQLRTVSSEAGQSHTRRIESGAIAVKGQEVDWSGMTVPAPSLRADIKKRIWDADLWHAPSDSTALNEAEKIAVAEARGFLARMNNRPEGARVYLWLLRRKHNGDYYKILKDVAMELRKRQ